MSDVSSDVFSSDLSPGEAGLFLLLGFKRPGHVDAGLNAIKPHEPQGSSRAFPLAVFLKSDRLLSGVRKGSGNAQTGTSRYRHATSTVFVAKVGRAPLRQDVCQYGEITVCYG